jgi:hypothetical protein
MHCILLNRRVLCLNASALQVVMFSDIVCAYDFTDIVTLAFAFIRTSSTFIIVSWSVLLMTRVVSGTICEGVAAPSVLLASWDEVSLRLGRECDGAGQSPLLLLRPLILCR